jgi:thimet oligopeptidase
MPQIAPLDGAAPLTQSPKEFVAAAKAGMLEFQKEIEALKKLPRPSEPYAALEAYDRAQAALSLVDGRASIAQNMHPDSKMRDAGKAILLETTELWTNLYLDAEVFQILRSVDAKALDAGSAYWLEKVLLDYRQSGIDQPPEIQAKLKALNAELETLSQKFAENIAGDVREIQLGASALEGLPADFVQAHPPGHDGKIVLTTNNTDYVPVMKYATRVATREAMWRAYSQRAFPANEEVLKQILLKRHEVAQRVGYPNWPALSTSTKMIGSPEKAQEFIEQVGTAVRKRAQNEYQVLLQYKKKASPEATRVFPWELSYLLNKVQQERGGLDPQKLRPYLDGEKVKQGVLETTGKLLGIEYRRQENRNVWDPTVETYDVLEKGERKGRVYLDLFPRDDKYKHYAHFKLAGGKQGARLPESVVVGNFPKPSAGKPALLEMSDVRTFFHEFGHAVHGILGGQTRWHGTSGVATERDFVEAPSQLLEEWIEDPEIVRTFAKHFETGEAVPAQWIVEWVKQTEFGRALGVAQQMFYAALSLSFYSQDPATLDMRKTLRDLYERYTPFEYVDGYYSHTAFGHLDGYSSNYYTYMWSLVIAKDLFSRFKQEGLMNAETGARYRRSILEPGGTRPASRLSEDFLGRPYQFDAFDRWLSGS